MILVHERTFQAFGEKQGMFLLSGLTQVIGRVKEILIRKARVGRGVDQRNFELPAKFGLKTHDHGLVPVKRSGGVRREGEENLHPFLRAIAAESIEPLYGQAKLFRLVEFEAPDRSSSRPLAVVAHEVAIRVERLAR